jgi:hypothetical protein
MNIYKRLMIKQKFLHTKTVLYWPKIETALETKQVLRSQTLKGHYLK